MKKILVPVDFSSCANNAVDFAVQSAKYLPVEITLLHAFELTGNVYTDYMGVNQEFNQTLLDKVKEELFSLEKSIKDQEGLIVKTAIYKSNVKEAILEACAENNIDLVVMGTLGASGLKEKLWGSKTASLIGDSKVPVLVIPCNYKWHKPNKILVATNQFEKDQTILDFIFELASLYQARVQVAVFTDENDDNAEAFLEHGRKIPAYEKMLKEQYKEDTITAIHLYGNEFEETLHDYIKKYEIDILAMVTYPRSFWDRIFHPSITKRISYHTDIPLLAIPARKDY